jgi:hypothetical protein
VITRPRMGPWESCRIGGHDSHQRGTKGAEKARRTRSSTCSGGMTDVTTATQDSSGERTFEVSRVHLQRQ